RVRGTLARGGRSVSLVHDARRPAPRRDGQDAAMVRDERRYPGPEGGGGGGQEVGATAPARGRDNTDDGLGGRGRRADRSGQSTGVGVLRSNGVGVLRSYD